MNKLSKWFIGLLTLLVLTNYSCKTERTERYIYPKIETVAWDHNNDGNYDEIREDLKEYKVSGNDTTLSWIYPISKTKISMTKEEILKKYGKDIKFLEVCE